MTSTLPPVIRAAYVARSPADAFAIFTDEIGAWWPLPTHGLFGAKAGGLSFRDGSLIEQSVDGSETIWGEVVEWQPPNRLTFTWHPGQDASAASQVQIDFEADGDGTRVVLEHRGWEAFGQEAMARRHSYVGPNAWGGVLDHFADGAEPRPDAADLTALSAAYQAFFAEAGAGGFGDAPDGGWNADQVLAHVALNDAAIVAVCQALVHQDQRHVEAPTFANQVCQDQKVLGDWIAACGNRDQLIERGRLASRQAMAALARLSPEQLDTMVACYLTHEGEVAMDQAAPWQAVAVGAQTSVHLPAHIEQLQNLRSH